MDVLIASYHLCSIVLPTSCSKARTWVHLLLTPHCSFRPLKYNYHLKALHLISISPIYSFITLHSQNPLLLYISLQNLPPTSSRTSVEKSHLSVPSKLHVDISSAFFFKLYCFPSVFLSKHFSPITSLLSTPASTDSSPSCASSCLFKTSDCTWISRRLEKHDMNYIPLVAQALWSVLWDTTQT